MARGDFRAMYNRNGIGVVPRAGYPNGKSTTILNGEPVVLTTNATYTTSSNPVVRTLLAADISASYAQGSTCGILGFALHDAVTNASGVASSAIVYSAKASAAEPTLMLPSYGMGQPPDTTISYTEIMVALALPGVVFRGKLGGGGTTTASNVLVNTTAGIDLASSTFTVDTSESVKPLHIVGWDPSDTDYVFFEVLPAFCQLETGINYSSN